MIALGGPTLKQSLSHLLALLSDVSMIALGGPTLKRSGVIWSSAHSSVSMIALGGPTLKLEGLSTEPASCMGLNDSTGRAYTETAGYVERRHLPLQSQ